MSPLSGYEPLYNPDRYNDKYHIRTTHNCFAYAFDHMEPPAPDKCTKNSCPVSFHQPGKISGYPGWNEVDGKRCPDILARLHADVSGISLTTFDAICDPGYSKIALVVSPKDDYHFYRQDSNGYWSHKPGSMPVTNKDSSGNLISNPEIASRDYSGENGGVNYERFCSYLCIPRNGAVHKFGRGGKRKKSRTVKRVKLTRRHHRKSVKLQRLSNGRRRNTIYFRKHR